MPVIYSTCSRDNTFPKWQKHPRLSAYEDCVVIKGGAGVQNKRTLETPYGAATIVSADDLKFLQGNDHFKRFVEDGYMVVDEKANSRPSEDEIENKVDEELTEKDKGAQDSEETYKELNKKPPVKEKK